MRWDSAIGQVRFNYLCMYDIVLIYTLTFVLDVQVFPMRSLKNVLSS
jgi:hypothetical protein